MSENFINCPQQDTAMLLKELEVSKMIHKQIAKLNSERDLKKAINEVLACVGQYLGAERAYIFEEIDDNYSNTFEWCAEGVRAEIDNLQNISAQGLYYWVDTLIKGRCVIIPDIESIREADPFVYNILIAQNIRSVIEAPIMIENRLIGFIGVDNAPEEITKIVEESLKLLGTFLGTVIRNREEHEKICKSHEEMRNSRNMQREMLDSINCGVFAYTVPEHRILLINDEAKKLISCKDDDEPVEAILSFMENRIHHEDKERVFEAESRLKNPGDAVKHSYRVMTDDGIMNIQSDVRLLQLENSQKYILCCMLDITECELMEKKLNEERVQYRNALALGSETFFTVNLNDNVIDEYILSESGEKFIEGLDLTLPLTYDKLAEQWFSDKRIVYNDDDIELAKSSAGLIETFEKGKSIIRFEYFIPDMGKYRRILIILYKIDSHIYASFVIYDITSSRSEEKQHRDIIESLGKIYTLLNYISLSENKYAVFRCPDDIPEYIPQTGLYSDFIDIYTKYFVEEEYIDDVARYFNPKNIRERLADTDYLMFEFRRKNLGWFRANIVVSARNEEGEATAVILAGNVINGQKTAELAQQAALKAAYEAANMASSAKTDFLANMSHDIRTPMNAIIGLTAIAGTHMDDKERLADCLSKITVSSKHLLGIINEVLDMSKIESGKMELQEDEFNLPELIDNLLTMSKSEVNAKKHKLSVSIKNIDHENVIGDSQRIQQVFMNIMSNAIKYTPVGGDIRLTISEKSTNKPKIGCYEFIFEDNGIGMSEDFLKHVFEPFARAKNDMRIDSIQGTGLGMSITKNIVQMMNGDIKVESRINEGTKMTVTFFLKLRNQEEKIDYEKFINLPVLVADDDETCCIYACEMLAEMGMNGEWVLTGREAVERTVEHNRNGDDFFAIILDWKMPEMDGVETVREIRKRVAKEVPIIIVSAYDWTDIELEARAAGANAFISKPLFKSRMVHLFNELIGDEDEPQAVSELDAFAEENFTSRRALLVEDNELNAEIAGEILDMAGLEVEFATDGKQAVDIISSVEDGYFDVIFMDIQMPVMNGYEAARAIRALSGDYPKSVPIIAMTANAFAEDVTMAKNAGMNEHIAKPLDFAQLLKALKKWL
ncbi:MAG: response regulator [Ruminococcus flavefaciens]|nr:response regulator [Ruminococcus flavefaciens]MCM1229339.1 response regulator [Ruminococcus flavefaciens]